MSARRLGRLALAAAVSIASAAAPAAAHAFCGFYVAGADAKLFNNATMVVLMREGTRTVLSMQNNYQGPPEDFAMVVPVPVILQKANVKTLPRDVFDRVDRLAAPRLVEYWEQDPCGAIALDSIGTIGGTGQGFGSGHGRLGGSHAVKVEARFEVGEYEVVILSAKDSGALDSWLRDEQYRIPEGAEPVLRPYVQAGMYFFVAKVNAQKVRFENGMATLSPLRFHYDAATFSLPVRLGLLNSPGTQDLIVHTLAPGTRYETANYPNVTIPTNLDVSERARDAFGAFYAALFDKTARESGGAVVTEYAWGASSCDPCPSPPLGAEDLMTLGGDVLPSAQGKSVPGGAPPLVRGGRIKVEGGGLPQEVVERILRQNFGRYRLCYEAGLRNNPNLQGGFTASITIDAKGAVTSVGHKTDLPDISVVRCLEGAIRSVSFPAPEGGAGASVRVSYPLRFAPGQAGLGGGGGAFSNFVLTRLHVRYGKETLGEDLVFRAADPIQGGREIRGKDDLEHGAAKSRFNNFQARYAIRHPWTGAVACDKPVRGIWGGPPEGMADRGAVAAQGLAFAPRDAKLETFLVAAQAAAQPSASAAPVPSSARAPAAPSSSGGCGACAIGGYRTGPRPIAVLLAAAALFAGALRSGNRAARYGRRRCAPRRARGGSRQGSSRSYRARPPPARA